MDQYVITTPGGRVVVEPQNCYLLHPIVTPVRKLLVWVCGHGDQSTTYYYNDGSSLILELLALGWHVLVITSPSGDWNIAPAGVQHITVGGVPTAITEHQYSPLDGDGGPSSCRMWTDEIIRCTNQAVLDVVPTKMVLAGHSGGLVAAWVASCDTRFNGFYLCACGISKALGAPGGGPSDWEQDIDSNPIYAIGNPSINDVWRHFAVAASRPGLDSANVTAYADEYWPITNLALYNEQSATISEQLTIAGANGSFLLDTTNSGRPTTPNHDMTIWRVRQLMARIATYA
jgi:hypothetical protein